jgi:hypothetical protein
MGGPLPVRSAIGKDVRQADQHLQFMHVWELALLPPVTSSSTPIRF